MSIWHYTGEDRQPLGPLSTDELKQRLRAGEISFDTLVWREGMLTWRPLGELAEPLRLHEIVAPSVESASPASTLVLEPIRRGPPPPPALEPEPVETTPEPPLTGRAVFALGSDPVENPLPIRREPAIHVDAGPTQNPYAPSHASLHARHVRNDHDVVYAGFWKRVAAALIDGVILVLVGSIGGEVLGAILSDLTGGGKDAEILIATLLSLLLYTLYHAWFHSSLMATPGKLAIGIKVVRGNGEPISFLRGVARYFAECLGALLLLIGYIMVAFTPRKQALHDMVCDTVVVDKWAFTNKPILQRHELGTVAVVVLVLYFGLVVVGGILLAIALPAYSDYARRARQQTSWVEPAPTQADAPWSVIIKPQIAKEDAA